MEKKFTIEEIKIYLLSKDSMGDALYFLSAKNIEAAVEEDAAKYMESMEEDEENDDFTYEIDPYNYR